MSQTLETVRALVAGGEVPHGYDELAADNITVHDAVQGLMAAVLVEDYPTFSKGPCALVLELDLESKPIHIVWGIPLGQTAPAVLITAYRPDPAKWDETWMKRRT